MAASRLANATQADLALRCPCDFAEAEAGVHAMIAHNGPFYYRCGYGLSAPKIAASVRKLLGKG